MEVASSLAARKDDAGSRGRIMDRSHPAQGLRHIGDGAIFQGHEFPKLVGVEFGLADLRITA